MKKIILVLVGVLFINLTNAQELKETYYDYVVGNIKESGHIDKNGFPIGEWSYYLEDGTLDYVINWTTKSTKEYYESGALKETRSFNPDTGARIGKCTTYYKNGNIKTKGVYDENGKENGEFISYLENGTLISSEHYKKGEKQE